jgi:hypothetical protein
MLLSKILSGTTVPAATKTRQQRADIGWRRVAEKQRTPTDSFELALRSASPGAGAVEAHMEDDDGEQEDDDEDESSKKQLCPCWSSACSSTRRHRRTRRVRKQAPQPPSLFVTRHYRIELVQAAKL